MARRMTIIFGISSYVKLVTLYCHTNFFGRGGRGRGIGGRVRENSANRFLLRMANWLIFIHNGGIRKVITQFRLNNGTHFSCYESLPKGYNVQMSLFHSHMGFYVTQWSTTRLCGGLSVYSHLPPPLRKKRLKLSFWDSFSSIKDSRFKWCNLYEWYEL